VAAPPPPEKDLHSTASVKGVAMVNEARAIPMDEERLTKKEIDEYAKTVVILLQHTLPFGVPILRPPSESTAAGAIAFILLMQGAGKQASDLQEAIDNLQRQKYQPTAKDYETAKEIVRDLPFEDVIDTLKSDVTINNEQLLTSSFALEEELGEKVIQKSREEKRRDIKRRKKQRTYNEGYLSHIVTKSLLGGTGWMGVSVDLGILMDPTVPLATRLGIAGVSLPPLLAAVYIDVKDRSHEKTPFRKAKDEAEKELKGVTPELLDSYWQPYFDLAQTFIDAELIVNPGDLKDQGARIREGLTFDDVVSSARNASRFYRDYRTSSDPAEVKRLAIATRLQEVITFKRTLYQRVRNAMLGGLGDFYYG
jgi:hypothetical protein